MPTAVLFLAANPTDSARLRLDAEHRAIDESLRRAARRDEFVLRTRTALRVEDLRRALLEEQPELAHFSGHGEGEAGLLLEDDAGGGQPVDTETLAELFGLAQPGIRCVLLNACYSEIQARAIARHVDYVVGMASAVEDAAAREFATAFYDGLGAGREYEQAFQLGINALRVRFPHEQNLPRLLTGGQARNARKQALIQEARHLELNKSHAAALENWRAVQELDPEDEEPPREIERIQRVANQSQTIKRLITKLIFRRKEIAPIYGQVVQRLGQLTVEEDPLGEAVLQLVEDFVGDELGAEDFTATWQAFSAQPAVSRDATPPYNVLAERLQRGELVLFLGSDIACQFEPSLPNLSGIVSDLARRAEYRDFVGPLSTIAEYYRITPYDRVSLLRHLRELMNMPARVPFYHTLAQLPQPLLVISACYNSLPEEAFRQAGKPFVLIHALINSSSAGNYEAGNVLIEYSDRDKPEAPMLEQELSKLELLEQGYSLIYKIRGSLDTDPTHPDPRQDALVVSEDNYFNFARHADTLVPDYLTNQFKNRSFLFLGFSPEYWEDRLLVRAVLSRRPPNAGKSFAVQQEANLFAKAYWEDKKVERYGVSLVAFLEELGRWL